MSFFGRFKKKLHENPAIDALYRNMSPIGADVEKIVSALSDMAMVFGRAEDSLYKQALLDQIKEYDLRMGSKLAKKIDETKATAMRKNISSLTLLSFYNELSGRFPGTSIAYALTDALHYECYQSLASGEGFADYLDYLNKRSGQGDDQLMTPAHKFGNDIAQILEISDPTFYFIIAQQTAVICESAGKLVRWVLFDEEITAAE